MNDIRGEGKGFQSFSYDVSLMNAFMPGHFWGHVYILHTVYLFFIYFYNKILKKKSLFLSVTYVVYYMDLTTI